MLYLGIGTNLNSTVLFFFEKILHINFRHEPKMYDAFEFYSNLQLIKLFSIVFMLRMCLGSYVSHFQIALKRLNIFIFVVIYARTHHCKQVLR